MAAPKLLFARPNGQSSVTVLFDQAMRQLPGQEEDLARASAWTVGGGLPAVASVIRISNVEFELVLAAPAPVAAGYSVTVAGEVTSEAGEEMDSAFLSYTFAVTAADADLVITSTSWSTPTTLLLTFSQPLEAITFDAYHEVAQFVPQKRGSRPPSVIGFAQSGATITVTFDSPGTKGAPYLLTLNREVVVSSSTGTRLLLGEEEISLWGQGQPPSLVSTTVAEDLVQVVSSEVFGEEGWPLSHGPYEIDIGSLGPSTAPEIGSTPATISFPGADLRDLDGETATFALRSVTRTVETGVSFLAVAASSVGSGSEAVGATTVLTKTAGAPFEVVFAGGTDSIVRAGRKVSVSLAISGFTPGATFPLLALTLLNTQTSVVIQKTVSNQALLKVFSGGRDLGVESEPFDPTVGFDLAVTDATAEGGFLAVDLNGTAVLGVAYSDLDQDLATNTGATAIAVTLGHPASPTEVFSVDFTADLEVETLFATGFLGQESKDLVAIPSSISATVATATTAPATPGFANTGKAAFGVHAEFVPEAGAIQVAVVLNDALRSRSFTGSIALLTGDQQVMDMVVVDQTLVLVDEPLLVAAFLNPTCWAGVLVSVALTIDGVDYSTTVPVTHLDEKSVISYLAPQPARWYHQRIANPGSEFGPAVAFNTP